MPRTLVFIPPNRSAFTETPPIGPGYPKDNKPEDMRDWGRGLSELYRTFERNPDELERVIATPPAQLSQAERRVSKAHSEFLTEQNRPLKGALLPDGRVDLADGRHRAHYLLERGSDPIPVWVTAKDERELTRFRDACHAETARTHPKLVRMPEREVQRQLGRTALAGYEPERPLPETHALLEKKEQTYERGIVRPERNR